MPMPTRVAVVNSEAGLLTGANAPVKFITAAAQNSVNPSYSKDGGMFAAYWTLICTAATGGSALPYFTWYDQRMAKGVTASGNQGIFGSASLGATALTAVLYLTASAASAQINGVQFMQCGSGASGASAYLGYGITGNVNTGGCIFDCQLLLVDDWAV